MICPKQRLSHFWHSISPNLEIPMFNVSLVIPRSYGFLFIREYVSVSTVTCLYMYKMYGYPFVVSWFNAVSSIPFWIPIPNTSRNAMKMSLNQERKWNPNGNEMQMECSKDEKVNPPPPLPPPILFEWVQVKSRLYIFGHCEYPTWMCAEVCLSECIFIYDEKWFIAIKWIDTLDERTWMNLRLISRIKTKAHTNKKIKSLCLNTNKC